MRWNYVAALRAYERAGLRGAPRDRFHGNVPDCLLPDWLATLIWADSFAIDHKELFELDEFKAAATWLPAEESLFLGGVVNEFF